MFCQARQRAVMCVVILSASLVFSAKAFCGKFPGEISQVKGVVEVQKAGKARWYKAVDGLPVQLKDKIKTQKNSSCNLELDDGSLIFVDENTEASVEFMEVTKERHSSVLGLWVGKLINNIRKTTDTKMKIKCPTAVISVRGTEFAVEVSSKAADVGVFEGEVAVSSSTEMSGEELEELASTSTAAVPASTSTIQAASLTEISVKPDQQTTVAQGEAPKQPIRLTLVMQKNRERLNDLRGRVQELRDRLKRSRPEYLDQVRQEVLDRVMSIKEQRDQLKEKLKNQRDQIR